MSDDIREKIAKLPVWAREHIASLSRSSEEIAALRKQLRDKEAAFRRLSDRCSMMTELLTCAGRGGSETAAEFVAKIVQNWPEISE